MDAHEPSLLDFANSLDRLVTEHRTREEEPILSMSDADLITAAASALRHQHQALINVEKNAIQADGKQQGLQLAIQTILRAAVSGRQ